jgi:hypothetical protein
VASKHAAEQKKIMTGVSAPGSFAGQANPSTRANLLLQLPAHSISSCGGRPRLVTYRLCSRYFVCLLQQSQSRPLETGNQQ